MRLPPMKCTVRVLEQEFSSAVNRALETFHLAVKQAAFLFFVLDGGNGYFYVYGGSDPLPQQIDFDAVFRNPILVSAEFSEVRAYMGEISADTEIDPDDPYLFESSDGSVDAVGPGDGDATLNRHIATLGIEAIEKTGASASVQASIHPQGCRVLFADDEVAWHGQIVETLIRKS